MSTTLAVVGACVLAEQIASHTALRDAFDGHERIMRPWVEQVQKLPPGMPRWLTQPRGPVSPSSGPPPA